MGADLSGLPRHELKYTVTESTAAAIADYIQPLFCLDPHVASGERRYVVNNVYLDTPGLRFYYDTKFRQLTRLKPRVRYYGLEPGAFLFLEVKHRHNTTSWKVRQRIPVEQWPGVLEVSAAERRAPVRIDLPETFQEVAHLYSAVPVLHVRYAREPYVSGIDEYGRITFDRALRCRPTYGSSQMETRDADMICFDDPVTAQWQDSPVVLEIKTQAFVPPWAIDIIRRFSLVQRGFSKYCYGIDRCLEDGHDAAGLAL